MIYAPMLSGELTRAVVLILMWQWQMMERC